MNADEELQNNLEKGQPVNESSDSRAYQKVFNALRREPFELPFHFADDVLHRLESKESLSKDYIWFGLGLFAFVAAAVFACLLANFKFDLKAPAFVNGYGKVLLFGALLIAVIQYIDQTFVRKSVSGKQ